MAGRQSLCAHLMVGGLSLCGCRPETLLDLLPQPEVEVAKQTPPFLMSTGGAPQTYLFLGYRDVYSTGLIDMAATMNAQGLRAKWLNEADWEVLFVEIEQAHAKGMLDGDLIFVGHSFGGDDAVNLARKLDQAGIPVRLVALVDATSPAPIPANVDYCYNLYKPNLAGALFPNSFAGNPVEPEPGNTHTQILNEPVTEATFGPVADQMQHFTIDSEPLIHQAIIDKIRELEGLP